ncbi:coadhesin-like [Saccostrea cucullata]|uniref:coadhesin-like n=1 Tax=Saccostrea cuccullata TaxID=36930 RepID=UPI002ED65828
MIRLRIVCFLPTISFIINLNTVSCNLLSCFDFMIGKKLSTTPIKILSDIGLETCLNQCVDHTYCLSVNYNRHEFICQLINRKKNNNETLLDDWDYIHKELPDIGHQSEKMCGAIACNNYSTCLHTSTGRYVCIATVNGEWGPWENWSSCSKSCAGGQTSRKRECNSPYPMYGGALCIGSETETASCNTNPCSGGGFFGFGK